MRPTFRLLPLALLLPGACAQIGGYGTVAVEQRRTMNDMQARATMAATCDIALGAYFRELSDQERRYVGLVCGGMSPARVDAPPAASTAADADRPEISPRPGDSRG